MTTSIRFTKEEEMKLQRLMEQTGLQKTQLIKQSLFVDNPIPIVECSRETYKMLHHLREEIERLELTERIRFSENLKEEMREICQRLSV